MTDLGGFITKSGLLIGQAGEPVIPAEVASSSRLLDALSDIAKGNSPKAAADNSICDTHINVTINGATPSSLTARRFDRNTQYKLEKFLDEFLTTRLRHRIAQ